MAGKTEKTAEQDVPEVPVDSELFVDEVPQEDFTPDEAPTNLVRGESDLDTTEELSEEDVFSGEDFYEPLADSAAPATAQSDTEPVDEQIAADQPLLVSSGRKRFSALQKVLVVSIVTIAAILLYTLLKSPPRPATGTMPAVQRSPLRISASESSDEDLAQPTSAQTQKPQSLPLPRTVLVQGSPAQPLSLKVADDLYLQADYNRAYAIYDQLHQSLPAGSQQQLLKDFLQLKMALCLRIVASRGLLWVSHTRAAADQADHLFRAVSKSRSPIVRALANYHCCLIETQKKQYLRARARAYQTIALISAIDFDRGWALSLQRNCHFLAAELITRQILSLCDADKNLPGQLWSNPADADPFTGLDEAQLCSLLESGSEQLDRALLGPQIRQFNDQDGSTRWSVVCNGASIEELLARFAANADLNITWSADLKPAAETVRERVINLYLPATTPQQFVTVAAGCAGLLALHQNDAGLARLDEKGTVDIFNPARYSSLSEHISLLSNEAISLWQRILLTSHGDERIPNVHFAMGLLYAQKGQLPESIAEYKLMANRFSQTPLAPFALLHSSKLKTDLRDYLGAREDLKQLTEQYPDAEVADQACLYLADATMKAGLLNEAARLYRKLYNLALSGQSQTAATLGAGRCFYEAKDYQSAAEWLTRYINLSTDRTGSELYLAYFLLGKANVALEKPEQACEAFKYALQGQFRGKEYVETVSSLIEAQIQQEAFLEALDMLEDVPGPQFSQRESIEILLLKSRILRAIGLVDEAITALGDRAQYLSDTQLKARVSFELSKCYITREDYELARNELTRILVFVEPSPLAHEIALELADVCLKLGQGSQTVSICSQLLDSDPSPQIKQKALYLIATACKQQKDYNRAALALLGQWNPAKTR